MIEGSFRDDLTVDDIAKQYPALVDLTEEGPGYSLDELVPPEESTLPDIWGLGPVSFSTSVEVLPVHPPTVIWDVNRYYKTLKVSPKATKGDLRKSYQEMEGQNDEYATYVLHQLLNPVVRRQYDLMPLGSILLDHFVQEEIKRRASLEAARRRTSGHQSSTDEVLAEWGFQGVEHEEAPATEMAVDDSDVWQYSFYLWEVQPELHQAVYARRWQEAIVRISAKVGLRRQISIGIKRKTRNHSPYLIANYQNRDIVFLQEGSAPAESIALDALAELYSDEPPLML